MHKSDLLDEIINALPSQNDGFLLDCTAGGGGHFFEMLARRPTWRGECWDRDPAARARIESRAAQLSLLEKITFQQKCFGDGVGATSSTTSSQQRWNFVLADLGVSSFQLDDATRGMSFRSEARVDFRMDPSRGPSFLEWLRSKTILELADIMDRYGEEPKAQKLAEKLNQWAQSENMFLSAKSFADEIARALAYPTASRVHPATRAFQALRIAINDEMGELERLLTWAPPLLAPGGRLAIISFHSIEDRITKYRFRDLEKSGDFVILTKKPVIPSDLEVEENSRSRSAKLRILERRGP